ncbi:regulatory protein RecX [Siphonobacter aquaeclarae]|uniref:Regulatory protein RecX n=1 Tax=Siphonobacter aquaeclarae TaxID=563176 RepID=A0A1G9X7W3_9BACT|nr:regulatory protein RecX [Siphonobacter aquaeclarae]SDM92818.1 regulatory protein [Siphonobacter aquaeclarae]
MNADALRQAAHFCAYQERTVREVRDKLHAWEVSEEDADEIIARLQADGYLSDDRFARSFAGGKFRTRQWGKIRIEQEMRRKGIADAERKSGIAEIDADEYARTLKSLLDKKAASLNESDPWKRRQKLARFAMGKGYEADLIWRVLGEEEE